MHEDEMLKQELERLDQLIPLLEEHRQRLRVQLGIVSTGPTPKSITDERMQQLMNELREPLFRKSPRS